MNHRRLTPAQGRFATLVAAGTEPRAAYADAYPQSSDATRKTKPYVLLKSRHVHDAIEALATDDIAKARQKLGLSGTEAVSVARAVGLSRQRKREILCAVATDERMPASVRIRAIEVDNLMTGDNRPVRVEGEITLDSILKALEPSTGLPHPQELTEATWR
jgi:hypothetical protein